ncbi:hypothetical protein BUALT_Bualt12G0102700 [Buddleja alternifolia]|uniref:Transposase MuDR plant domain-containing protein n=1 Tax=Buddleja alternifolia TaxID=168488 RepID=A0AAV6WRF7_9LAMI|nr:hypothetical protein BUALT_Bualt12G0102700 [Buddleja alternifolia]
MRFAYYQLNRDTVNDSMRELTADFSCKFNSSNSLSSYPHKQIVIIALHYGGLCFEYKDDETAVYEVGSVLKFDHFEVDNVYIEGFKNFCDKIGLPKFKSCHIMVDNKFKELKDDDELHQFCLNNLDKTREVDIYLNYEDDIGVEEEEDIGTKEDNGDIGCGDGYQESDYDMNESEIENGKEESTEKDKEAATEKDKLNKYMYLFTSIDNVKSEQVHENADTEFLNYSRDEDINKSEDELNSTKGSIEENDEKKYTVFKDYQRFDPPLTLGLMFKNKPLFREVIHSHAIMTKRSSYITSNDKTRVYAKCADSSCKWRVHANKVKDATTFQIRSYVPDHTCLVNFNVKNVKSTWVAQKFLRKGSNEENDEKQYPVFKDYQRSSNITSNDKTRVYAKCADSSCVTVLTHTMQFMTSIMSINRRSEWKKTGFIPALPPNGGRGVGRTYVTRRVEPGEVRKRKVTSLKPQPEARAKKKVTFLRSTTVKTKNQGSKKAKEVSSSTSIPEVDFEFEGEFPLEHSTTSKAPMSVSSSAPSIGKIIKKNPSTMKNASTMKKKRKSPKPTKVFQLVDEDENGGSSLVNPPYTFPLDEIFGDTNLPIQPTKPRFPPRILQQYRNKLQILPQGLLQVYKGPGQMFKDLLCGTKCSKDNLLGEQEST